MHSHLATLCLFQDGDDGGAYRLELLARRLESLDPGEFVYRLTEFGI